MQFAWKVTVYLESPLPENATTLDVLEFSYICKGAECPDKEQIEYFCRVHLPLCTPILAEQTRFILPDDV